MNLSEASTNAEIDILDVVSLTEEASAENITSGTEGTVVDVLPGGAFEVEFTDSFGNTVFEGAFLRNQLRLVYSAVEERGAETVSSTV